MLKIFVRLRFVLLIVSIFAIAVLGTILSGPSAVAFVAGDPPTGPKAAGEDLWRDIAEDSITIPGERQTTPDVYRTLALNEGMMRYVLAGVQQESEKDQLIDRSIVSFPMPDGTFSRFHVYESSIMEQGLADKFPEIKTYAGRGIDEPAAIVRFDLTPAGFHAMIRRPDGTVFIDPFARGNTENYISYFKRDAGRSDEPFACLFENRQKGRGGEIDSPSLASYGTTLRTYRTAVAATAEYTAFHGGTVALGQAAIVTAINRVNLVYESEMSLRMVLVANNNLLVFTNAGTDGYTNNNGFTMLGENQTKCDTVIGNANYDIGHVFSTGGGGVAGLGVVGVTGQKAQGVTGNPSPTGDSFWIDYVAHEVGHQYGGNHTFNSTTSSCGGGNRNAGTAYERGSGSTIMAYAGICAGDDLQPNSDPYFHWASLNEISNYTNSGAGIGNTQTSNGNTLPVVDAGNNYTIPANTPFALTGTATDANGDALTYLWEEADLGSATTVGAADNGTSPISRSWNPTTSPTRTYPRLSNLLANTLPIGEVMPTTNRTLNFRMTVFDNRADGGFASDTMAVTVVNTGAAFAVTSPNTAVTWNGNTSQTVTWNVSGTTANGINAATVNILLSTDGGQTFPTTLASGVPNSGSANITVPNVGTTTARVKVQGAGNIFFDLSNVNFTITIASAAGVAVSGRVTNATGNGLRGAVVTLTDDQGVSRSVITGSFGYFRFDDVPTGENYVIAVGSKRYTFAPRIFNVTDEITNMDFVPE